jgi:hypothetical protein
MSDQQRVEEAIADPTRQFHHPTEVLQDGSLDVDEKRRILESWKKDAELLATAQAENMAGGEHSLLQDVSLALEELERTSGSRH